MLVISPEIASSFSRGRVHKPIQDDKSVLGYKISAHGDDKKSVYTAGTLLLTSQQEFVFEIERQRRDGSDIEIKKFPGFINKFDGRLMQKYLLDHPLEGSSQNCLKVVMDKCCGNHTYQVFANFDAKVMPFLMKIYYGANEGQCTFLKFSRLNPGLVQQFYKELFVMCSSMGMSFKPLGKTIIFTDPAQIDKALLEVCPPNNLHKVKKQLPFQLLLMELLPGCCPNGLAWVSKGRELIHSQGHQEEVIQDLHACVRKWLRASHRANNNQNHHTGHMTIVSRDGVGEADKSEVLLQKFNIEWQEQKAHIRGFGIFQEETCDALTFMGLPFKKANVDSQNWGSDIIVGVVDSYASEEPDLSLFQCFPRSLRKQETVHLCPESTRLSNHGIFCTNLIAGRSTKADFFGFCKGNVQGVVPSCEISTYAVGCKSCSITSDLVGLALEKAIQDKVNVISMSMGWVDLDSRPKTFLEDGIGEITLKAFRQGILVCVPAGNKGPDLKRIGFGIPWCLNVGACTIKRVGTTRIEVGVESTIMLDIPLIRVEKNIKIFAEIEGDSFNIFDSVSFAQLIMTRKTRGKDCVLSILKFSDPPPINLMARLELPHACQFPHKDFHLTRLAQAKVFGADTEKLWDWRNKYGKIYVKMSKSKFSDDIRPSFIPKFSSRGPSALYEEIMMPNIVAPGAAILASYSKKLPLHKKRTFKQVSSNQCLMTGTSMSCALAAGGIAYLMYRRRELGFDQLSPSGLISAVMTTAKDLGTNLSDNEFAFGAGAINVEKAVTPGLLYEETSDRLERYRQGDFSVLDLNFPSFATSFTQSHRCHERIFKRRLRNDDDIDDLVIYDSKIEYQKNFMDPQVEIIVQPPRLGFDHKGEVHSFRLICRVHPISRGYISATLTWRAKGKYGRSPREVVSHIILYEEGHLDSPNKELKKVEPSQDDRGEGPSQGKKRRRDESPPQRKGKKARTDDT